MGSLPALSILKGKQELLCKKGDPLTLHTIFETTVKAIDSINNNNDKVPTNHGITIMEGTPELIFGNERLALTQLNALANQLARFIQKEYPAQANSDGDTVIAVDIAPSSDLVIALLAIWKLGAAYLPLDSAFPDSRVQHILRESQPALIIADAVENEERYDGSKVVTVRRLKEVTDNLSIEDLETQWAGRVSQMEQIAMILYTSGSTGVPKGVRLPHRVVLNRLKWQWKAFPYSATENICVFKTALTFVDSVSELWGPLLWGRSLLILTKSDIIDIEKFIRTLDYYKIERLVLVPSLLHSMLLYLGLASNEKTPFRPGDSITSNKLLKHLKYCICSGEVINVSLAQKFYQFFNQEKHLLLNFYGSTEIMGDVLFHPIIGVETLSPMDKIPIGRAVDNTNVYILDRHLRPVRFGEIGELYVSGLNLASGYVRNRDPDKFVENPLAVDPEHRKLYRTGDYARISDGVAHYEGRTDSQIKVRGHKVDLSEVEAAVAKVPNVDKSVVLVYKAGQIDQALLTFVTSKTVVEESKLEEELLRLLPPYMVPQVVILSNIPYLVNGKVDRQSLLRHYEQHLKRDSCESAEFDYSGIPRAYQRQATALFETIAQTLGHSLKAKITASSNYYNLGGNSLNSVLAVTKLRDLGFVISIGDFISSSTMLDIVMRMNEEEATGGIKLQALNQIPDGKYTAELLNDSHKDITISIITSSFYQKAELEQLIAPQIKVEDYVELIGALWESLLEQRLSFVVKNQGGEIIAVNMNLDANAEPDVTITSKLAIIFEFLESLEGPFRDNVLPKGTGQVLHSFMAGTASHVSPQQNIELMLFMEQHVLKLARRHGFAGVFTTNTSPLTQQLGTDVFEYKVLLDYQINKYVASDGSTPFAHADNSYRAVVSWKEC